MEDRKKSKVKGIISENLFINECSSRNISVFKNQNDIGEIDYVILVHNKLLKVQIKSTSVKRKECYYISTKRNDNKLYSNIDYFACYIHPTKEWYIIPNKIVGDRQAVSISCVNNKYKDYKSNWTFDVSQPLINNYNNVESRSKCISLFNEGKSKSEIARVLDVHYSVINRWLREAGFGIRKLEVPKEDIIKLYNSGKTMKEVASELGTTVWTMRNLFRKYNINVRVNRNPNGKSKSSKIKELQN